MKRLLISLVALTLGLMMLPSRLPAQMGMMQGKGAGGWGMGSQYGRMYDPKTVETVRGEVEREDVFTPMKGMSGGVHLMLKTNTGAVSVHLGPQWYLNNQDVQIRPGDRVEVTGSRITFDGKK
jgi:hypothetical protein